MHNREAAVQDNLEPDNREREVRGNPVLELGSLGVGAVHNQARALHKLLDMEPGNRNLAVEEEGQEHQHSPWHSEAGRDRHRQVVTQHKQGLVEELGMGMRKGEEHRGLLPSLRQHVPSEHRSRQNLGQMMALVRSQRKEYDRSRLRV